MHDTLVMRLQMCALSPLCKLAHEDHDNLTDGPQNSLCWDNLTLRSIFMHGRGTKTRVDSAIRAVAFYSRNYPVAKYKNEILRQIHSVIRAKTHAQDLNLSKGSIFYDRYGPNLPMHSGNYEPFKTFRSCC